MSKYKFDPQYWLPTNRRAKESITDTVLDDIEIITQRIESARADITSGYYRWRDLGFALSSELGEAGRDIFHRISRFNPDYNERDCDNQYDKCLRAHGTGVTIKTFFSAAKEAGISISTPRTSAQYAKHAQYTATHTAETDTISANSPTAELAESADSAELTEEPLPTFSQELKGHLPGFLERIIEVANSEQDADILLLGSLTVLSSCLPHISGVYDKRLVFPNIFLFVTAKASSGKGRLGLCRYLVEPIHNRLREISEAEDMAYRQKLAEYNAAGKKKADMEKPDEPPMRMLFIPANSSATAVYQVLNDNSGCGLMFETEGDTLANTFGSDYGNYSDGFRKAFHHETISYIRRKDREYVNIRQPRLSTLLTGTPRQILNLITDAENGLFSRFIFYCLDLKLIWNNVFEGAPNTTLDDYFTALGHEYHAFHSQLETYREMRFRLTPEQETDFNAQFDAWQQDYGQSCGDEFVSSVRRLGLVTFRIAMILSALRMMDDLPKDEDFSCMEEDYHSAMTIASVILQHNARVFLQLPKAVSPSKPASRAKNSDLERFFAALPTEFTRKDFNDLAHQMGLNPRTLERPLAKWRNSGLLDNPAYGKYRKI